MDLATVDHLLTTTRSVRKRLGLTRQVEPEIIQDCLEIAIQAPTGSNRQGYHFVVITDPDKRAGLADLYRKAFNENWTPQRKEEVQQRDPRNLAAYFYLADHLHEVPVHIIPCIEGRLVGTELFQQATGYGGILPTAWSLMLALRARGVGSAWTTVHLKYAQEAAALSAALSYAQSGVRVNAVCPGYIRTPMVKAAPWYSEELEAGLIGKHPIGRLGKPEEIAEAVVWLCSDAASFVTGHMMTVDGGYVTQ